MSFLLPKDYTGKYYKSVNFQQMWDLFEGWNGVIYQKNNYYCYENFTQNSQHKAYPAVTSNGEQMFGVGNGNSTHSLSYLVSSDTSLYSGLQIRTAPVIMRFVLKKVSEYVPTSGYFYPLVAKINDSNGLDTPFTGLSELAYSSFISQYGDYYFIDEMYMYDNSQDGNYSEANQRTLIGTRATADLFARFSYSGAGWNSDPKTWNEKGTGDCLVPIYSNLILRFNVDRAKTAYFSNFLTDIKCFYGSSVSGQTNKIVTEMTNVTGAWKIFSFASLKKYLNMIGVPFTFSLTQALKYNTTNFTDYVPSGQPSDVIGGGTGDGDNSSDDTNGQTPSLSTIGSFNKQYAMSQSMLNVLSNYLWTSTFINDIKLLFNNPMEGVVNCRMYPFSLTAHDSGHIGASTAIQIGNVTTTAYGYPILSNYNCRFSLGSIKVNEYYGSAMDYEPYTTISIYLPYIGIKEISTNEVMNKTISIEYICDITNGATIAEILVEGKLLYTYEGKIGVEIPINSSNASQLANGLLSSAISTAGGVAISAVTGNPLAIAGTVLSTAKSVASSQFHINKGGISSPMAGFYLPQYAYLIINRPIQSLASSFGATFGFPCNVTKQLGTLTGYTEVNSPILNNIGATQEELSEIKLLLETGVILT